jgi:biotin synthase
MRLTDMDVRKLAEKITGGHKITFNEAEALLDVKLDEILPAAEGIRRHFKGDKVRLCSIVNARSGACSEDCRFCAQSGRHKTNSQLYPLLGGEELETALARAGGDKASCFGVVTSGRGMTGRELEKVAEFVAGNANKTLRLSCSLGELKPEDLKKLKAAGMKRYHHNIETAESFFPNICTTHTFADRVRTVKAAKAAGLEVCCGGIIGLGESPKQRLEFAFTLRELNVDSVPVNILNPIPGTPLENRPRMKPEEILSTIAVFRFILPDKDISVCGGREANLGNMQNMIFRAGANGMMVGGYLTTPGRSVEEDLKMIKELGLEVYE